AFSVFISRCRCSHNTNACIRHLIGVCAEINDPISVQVRAKARSGDEAVEYSKLKKVQRLGGGNYGEVWCCILTDASGHHTSPVAIKELNATYSLDSVAVEVFMQEAVRPA
ncbi:hypothetical protein SARC_16979, partial [Sphaeroforma arctica JP610]